MLIQKDTKRKEMKLHLMGCLRALLIQKDTKPRGCFCILGTCLRALLIQKDTKLNLNCKKVNTV